MRGFSLPPPTTPSLFEAARVDVVRRTTGDVRDLAAVTAAVAGAGAEVVLHMAAQPLVRESYRDPVGTYATNVMGTVHLLEAVRLAGGQVRAVVVVTTDKCYENREWVWGYREDEPMGGHDPYSNSKGCAELVAAAYRSSYFAKTGTAVATARAGNVIGGGDWAADRLVPDMMRAFAAGKPVVIRNPNSTRPWQLVLEPLVGYLTLAERLVDGGQAFAEAFNFGPPGGRRPAGRVDRRPARRAGGATGPGGSWPAASSRTRPTPSSSTRARPPPASVGRPRTDLGLALAWITDWYKAFGRGDDVRATSLRQITAFLDMQPVGSN